jgi:hypothetical protein
MPTQFSRGIHAIQQSEQREVSLREIDMRYSVIFSIVLLQAASNSSNGQERPPVTLEAVESAWKERQEKVRTARFTWTEENTFPKGTIPGRGGPGRGMQAEPPDDVVKQYLHSFVLDGKKLRITLEGELWLTGKSEFQSRRQIISFDGKSTKIYEGEAKGAFPHGSNYSDGAIKDFITPTSYSIVLWCRARDNAISPLDISEFKLSESTVSIGDKQCILLEKPTKGRLKETCAVDPQRDFIVLRYSIDVGGKPTAQLEVDYVQDASCGWVPNKWTYVVLSDRTGHVRESSRATVTEYKIDEPVSADETEFAFPPKTLVDDNVDKTKYMVKDDGSRRTVTPEERRRSPTYEELLATESGKAGLPKTGSSRLYWLLPVPVLAVALALVARRMLRRRKAAAGPDSEPRG